jgi:hypothetical protein
MTHFTFYNENSAKNAPLLIINNVRFYFSYNTLVGLQFNGETYIIKNYWGPTTGKHLNWIDCYYDHKNRLSEELFSDIVNIAKSVAGIKELPTMSL